MRAPIDILHCNTTSTCTHTHTTKYILNHIGLVGLFEKNVSGMESYFVIGLWRYKRLNYIRLNKRLNWSRSSSFSSFFFLLSRKLNINYRSRRKDGLVYDAVINYPKSKHIKPTNTQITKRKKNDRMEGGCRMEVTQIVSRKLPECLFCDSSTLMPRTTKRFE